MPRLARAALALATLAPSTLAQQGDQAGEPQPALPSTLVVPRAPALSAADEAATFALPPGLRIELVAAEPLVVDPVAIAFDEDGRLWALEMRGYMQTIDGEGERERVGRVAVLEDTDGDGRMDARSEFLDGLVMPRALALARGGALVIAPPDLLFCRDTDGDGRADVREVVDTGLSGLENPEHAINGLLYTHAGAYRCANAQVEYRFANGAWGKIATAGGGQWGITKDDLGRVFFNTNPDPLRGDRYPSRYAVRNPSFGTASGVNVGLVEDKEVWPARITPGVNRGYRAGTLRDDFRLRVFTAACGPHVYRGQLLPPAYAGNAFVCEPAGNLVKRYLLADDGNGGLVAENAWPGREFLTSTDERFRPVNLAGGPDGGLYVVDFYRGIIQHRIYMTSFLRQQVLERGLDEPVGLGRIWRIVPEDARRARPPRLSGASWTDLAGLLSHPAGWWRDTAQRLIAEEGAGERDALELVREELASSPSALGRVHALFALAGIEGLRRVHVERALGDPDPRVRHAALQVAEPFLARGDPELAALVAGVGRGGGALLRAQALLSLGEAQSRHADERLAELLTENASSREQREAALSGLYQRELAFLDRVLAREEFRERAPGRAALLAGLARCVTAGRSTHEIAGLFERIAALPAAEGWARVALLDGVLAGRGKGPRGGPGYVRVPGEVVALLDSIALDGTAAETEAVRGKALEVRAALLWPEREDVPPELVVRPLSAAERERFERGREHYASTCAACHQPTGRGEPGKAPPLRGSEWALGSPERAAAILLQGLDGPLVVDGETWDMEMPAFVADDATLAEVLTYVRREWENGADPVDAELVRAVREKTRERARPWTAAELAASFAE